MNLGADKGNSRGNYDKNMLYSHIKLSIKMHYIF